MKHFMIVIAVFWMSAVAASQQVTLDDGRQAILNDDFTWHYIQNESQASENQHSVEENAVAPVIATPPVNHTERRTRLQLNSHKSSLLLSESGVEVVLGAATYQGGRLVIPTAITNQGSQSVIAVKIHLEVLDGKGKPLAIQDEITIWQSIKRMADTYLRPKMSVVGKIIHVDVEEASDYQLVATISAIETR
ncbi:DUF3157 family protein [Vibrio mangrovi]|uniref:DUF3157 family protein n=1 Tax=Vibrio mangrovi TaxID=474394 RepID=A0A1Y6IW28_9VIBR|nr:DUF3157 family protein [Vibrio mangrovi]MDW6005058.1 DUF3157 family protein [Vibrio mangrovi]SMS01826.1 hypothetical protein VIM7927_03134 [Vibrio mangrovi]